MISDYGSRVAVILTHNRHALKVRNGCLKIEYLPRNERHESGGIRCDNMGAHWLVSNACLLC